MRVIYAMVAAVTAGVAEMLIGWGHYSAAFFVYASVLMALYSIHAAIGNPR